jgi:hypothetical protein
MHKSIVGLLQGALNWERVAAAIQAGCTSPALILNYISESSRDLLPTQQQQLQGRHKDPRSGRVEDGHSQSQQVLQQQVWRGQVAHASNYQSHLGQQVIETDRGPIVSKAHLMRQLRAWCEEGRLEQVARGYYQLAQVPDSNNKSNSSSGSNA